MIFIGLSFGFIGAIGAFPSTMTSPIDTSDTSLDILENLTQNVTGAETMERLSFSDMWLIATGAMIGGGIILSILTGTTNMIGIWLFGSLFWSAWSSLIIMLNTFDFLVSGAGAILVTMITVGMSIMFYGAVVGMLSGTHSLR